MAKPTESYSGQEPSELAAGLRRVLDAIEGGSFAADAGTIARLEGRRRPSVRLLEVITEDQLERVIRQYIAEAEALGRGAVEIEAGRNSAR